MPPKRKSMSSTKPDDEKSPIKIKIKTCYYPGLIDPDEATSLYSQLESTIKWEAGVRSRSGATRSAKDLKMDEEPVVTDLIQRISCLLNLPVLHCGIYLNNYRNGNDFTPNHRHQGTCQLVISLGATRQLVVGKKTYDLRNGDVIVFGSVVHGVPKQLEVTTGRISIATFSIPLSSF